MQVGIAAAEAKSHIIVERRGSVGFITLNRPKALNALSLPMVRELLATLQAWRATRCCRWWRLSKPMPGPCWRVSGTADRRRHRR